MANYTMRPLGTAINLAACLDGDPDVASECMSIANHNSWASGMSDGDDVYLADTNGGVYRNKIVLTNSGSDGNIITYHAYAGHTPVIKGSDVISGWTVYSGNVWQATLTTECDLLFLDDVWAGAAEDDLVSVTADKEWVWVTGVLYQYSTSDPDTRYTSPGTEASQRGCLQATGKSYITVDGIEFRHGDGVNYDGGVRTDNCSYLVFQNCEAHWNAGQGISIKGDYCTIDNCTASYNGSHNISAGGTWNDPSTYMTLSNNTVHHGWTRLFSGSAPWDGYGVKFLFVNNGKMFGNTVYSNAMQGVDIDGSHDDQVGCNDCEVYENLIYDNGFQGVLVEIFSDRNKIYHNLIYDNGVDFGADNLGGYEVGITHICEDTEIYNNLIYQTKAKATAASEKLIGINEYDAAYGCPGTLIYGNTMVGNGYATNGVYVDGYTSPEDMKVINNIIFGTSDQPILVSGASFTGLYIDYNCLDRDPHSTAVITIDWVGYTIGTIEASGYGGPNNINEDPLFTDEGGDDYTLASNSPCKNVGDGTLGSPYNIALMPSSTWPDGVVTGDQDDY